MKFFAAAAAALLGAEAVLASPVNLVPRAPRASKRGGVGGLRRTQPKVTVAGPTAVSNNAVTSSETHGNATSNVSYSSNWAGAVLIGSRYTSVTGTFKVPTPSKPSGGSSSTEYSASAWVGIDGDTCSTSILQTGIDFNIQGGRVTYDAWYEWFPDYAYTFDGFDIAAGNVIRLTATAATKSSGSVLIENLSTGRSVTHSFSGQTSPLCETNAEWIVEDFEEGNSLVPFADFGTVTFTNAAVTQSGGTTLGVSGATIIDLRQNGKVLTSCSTSGSSTVSCDYV